MAEQIPFEYRDFHDVPRMFALTYRGTRYLFDGSFDDELDEYPDEYRVFALPDFTAERLGGSWAGLRASAARELGTLPVSAVEFDPTLRRSIGAGVLKWLGVDTGAAAVR